VKAASGGSGLCQRGRALPGDGSAAAGREQPGLRPLAAQNAPPQDIHARDDDGSREAIGVFRLQRRAIASIHPGFLGAG